MKEARLRCFLLGVTSLAFSLYSLSNNRKTLSTGLRRLPQSGNILSFPWALLRDIGFKSIQGSEPFYAILNAVVSSLLLVGINTSNEVLLLPSLTYAGSELIRIVSYGIVKSFLIYSKYGFYSAINFASFSFSVLAVVTYLWFGIPRVCEEICLKKATLQNVPKKYLQLESFAENKPKSFAIDNDTLIKFLVSAKEVEKKLLKQLEELKRVEGLKILDSGEPLAIENQKHSGES